MAWITRACRGNQMRQVLSALWVMSTMCQCRGIHHALGVAKGMWQAAEVVAHHNNTLALVAQICQYLHVLETIIGTVWQAVDQHNKSGTYSSEVMAYEARNRMPRMAWIACVYTRNPLDETNILFANRHAAGGSACTTSSLTQGGTNKAMEEPFLVERR